MAEIAASAGFSTVTNFLKDIFSGDDEEQKKFFDEFVKEQLDKAETRQKLFESRLLEEEERRKYIPIKNVIKYYNKVCINVSDKPNEDALVKGIFDGITGIVKNVNNDSVVDGIKDVFKGILSIFIGEFAGNFKIEQKYFTLFGKKTCSVYRVDYELYLKKFSSKTIHDKMQDVLIINYSISSIDIDKLNSNSLRTILELTENINEDDVESIILKITNKNSGEKKIKKK